MSRGLLIGAGILGGGALLALAFREREAIGGAIEMVYEKGGGMMTTPPTMINIVKEGGKRIMGLAEELAAKIAAIPYFQRKPSVKLLTLVADAAARYEIPGNLLLAVIYNESGFSEKIPNFRKEPGSYAKWQKSGAKIPGTNQKWTDVYPADKWGSGGPTQTMIFNVVGKPGGLNPGEWFDKLTLEMSIDLGARALKDAYNANADKPDALRWYYAVARYNGSGIKTLTGYVIHVAAHLNALGAGATLLTPEAIAAIRGNLTKAQADPNWKKDASTWASQFNKIVGPA
jgi:hypothetical protein